MDVPIEKLDSPINGTLEIIIRDGRYALVCGNAIYSFEDKYYNFRIGLGALDLTSLLDKPILVLGWGLGSILQLLEQSYSSIPLDITAIEKDPTVIELFNTFILRACKNKPKTIIDDAVRFLEKDRSIYSLIIIDIFIEDNIPETIQSRSFLQSVCDRLDENGLVIFNTLQKNKGIESESNSVKHQFKQIFPDVDEIKINKNELLMNTSRYLKNMKP